MAVHKLANESPSVDLPGDAGSSFKDLVNNLAGDVDDILSNGYNGGNGGASLQTDNGRVQADGSGINCPAPNSNNSGNSGNSGNTGIG